MKKYAFVTRPLAAALVLASLTLAGPADQAERVVKRQEFKNEPLTISNLQVNGQQVTFGEPFSAGVGWTAGVSFDVTNVSDKTITMLKVIGTQKDLGAQVTLASFGSFTAKYGVAPTSRLAPQETLHFDFSREASRALGVFPLAIRARFLNLQEMTIQIGLVMFDDDTSWKLGETLERDPNNKDHWVIKQ